MQLPVRFPRTGGPIEECRNPARQPLEFSNASTCQGTVTDSRTEGEGRRRQNDHCLDAQIFSLPCLFSAWVCLGRFVQNWAVHMWISSKMPTANHRRPLAFGNTYAVKLCPRVTPSYWAMRSASCCGTLSGRTWGRKRRTRKGRKGGRMRRPLGPSWGDLEAVLGVS